VLDTLGVDYIEAVAGAEPERISCFLCDCRPTARGPTNDGLWHEQKATACRRKMMTLVLAGTVLKRGRIRFVSVGQNPSRSSHVSAAIGHHRWKKHRQYRKVDRASGGQGREALFCMQSISLTAYRANPDYGPDLSRRLVDEGGALDCALATQLRGTMPAEVGR